ncbi:Hypothetical predicted protein, partial [Marmota monax]
ACEDMVMSQSPDLLAVSAGDMVTSSCKSSQSLLSIQKDYMAWNQQKPGQFPGFCTPGRPPGELGLPRGSYA